MYMDHVVQGGWETLKDSAVQAVKGGGGGGGGDPRPYPRSISVPHLRLLLFSPNSLFNCCSKVSNHTN